MDKNEQLDQLFKEWKSSNNYQRFKSDGIIDEVLFKEAKKKILFIGKEANDPDGEDGDFRTWWNQEMTGGFSIRIGEWAYGLLHDFPVFETIEKDKKWRALRSISFMDVKKPAGGGSSIESEIIDYIKRDMEFIKKEIEIIDPEIIISFIGSKGNQMIFGEDWNKTGYYVNYLKSERRLVIDFYHPSNQGGSTMNYVLLEKTIKQIHFNYLKRKYSLKNCIDSFFKEMTNIEGNVFQSKTITNLGIDKIKENYEGRTHTNPIMSLGLIIQDITEKYENGKNNNYPANYSSEVKLNDLEGWYDNYLILQGNMAISFAYEKLESLLYDLVTSFICIKYQENRISENLSIEFDGMRKLVKQSFRGSNNKELFEALKLFSSHFNFHYDSETKGSLKNWYIIISEIRHAIIHSSSIISNNRFNSFSKDQKSLLLDILNLNEKPEIIEIKYSYAEAKRRLKELSEFGYFVFKSLSLELGTEWKILMHQK